MHHERDAHKELAEVGKQAQEEYDKRMHITRPQKPASPTQGNHRRASIKMAPSDKDEYHRSADVAGVASFEVSAEDLFLLLFFLARVVQGCEITVGLVYYLMWLL